jgi:hypothetical protein
MAVAAAVVVGAASLVVAHPLGYDAWSWMVWARELLHGDLQMAGGPAIKALPVIVMAPLTPLGGAAPLLWLALMRISALVALLLAYRVGERLNGRIAGLTAAALLVVGPDLYRTALYGSAEPLLLVFVLGAAERFLAGRPRAALALLGAGGLIRPELWPIVGVLALLALWEWRRPDPVVLAAAVLPPAIWLSLVWAGTGNPFAEWISISATAGPVAGVLPVAAANGPAVEVLIRVAETIVLPALVLAVVAVVDGVRHRRMQVPWLAAVAIAWILLVAVMAQAGYPGSRRYLLGPASLLAVLAGAGLALVVASVRGTGTRIAVGAALGGVILLAAFPTVRESARLIGVAREQDRTMSALRDAVALAGGRRAVLAAGRPAVNPWLQTALAWEVHAPLADVQATWGSRRAAPHWRPPAVVFRGPVRLAGPRPVLPAGGRAVPVGRTGGWQVVRVYAG